jgi:hypothetical protein
MEVNLRPLTAGKILLMALPGLFVAGLGLLAGTSFARNWGIVAGALVFIVFFGLVLAGRQRYPKLMDEGGIVRRDGRRIGWSEITKVVQVVTKSQFQQVEHWEFRSSNGTVVIAQRDVTDFNQVLTYALAHSPAQAKRP